MTMISPLLPATRELLKGVRPSEPFFSNMILGELFDDAHTRGSFKVLPFAGGGFLIFDSRAPLGKGTVSRHPTIDEAQTALEALAASQAADESSMKTPVAKAETAHGATSPPLSSAASGVAT